MIKKFNAFAILAIFGTFVLASCGGNTESTTTEENTTDEAVTEAPAAEEAPVAEEAPAEEALDLSAGEAIYTGKGLCMTCHQANGEGMSPSFPPLANADYLLADTKRAIHQTLNGASEPITVNGVEYPGGIMGASVKALNLTDKEVADVVNYILNSWGNNGGTVTEADVAAVRAENE